MDPYGSLNSLFIIINYSLNTMGTRTYLPYLEGESSGEASEETGLVASEASTVKERRVSKGTS